MKRTIYFSGYDERVHWVIHQRFIMWLLIQSAYELTRVNALGVE